MYTLFHTGIRLFDQHEFFECHDTWEQVWMEASGRDRRFYQGMIQIAIGYYHAANGHFSGATSMHGKGIEKLTAYRPSYKGIDLDSLLPVLTMHRDTFYTLHREEQCAIDQTEIPTLTHYCHT